MNDRAIIGSLVHSLRELIGECPVCHCRGDSCSLETGEKCVLPQVPGATCSNPKCVTEAHWRKKRHRRDKVRPIAKRRTA